MTIGGVVISVYQPHPRHLVIAVAEPCRKDGVKTLNLREAAKVQVALDDDSRAVRPGDTVWWQGSHAYWTGKTGRAEVPLSRTSYSSSFPEAQLYTHDDIAHLLDP